MLRRFLFLSVGVPALLCVIASPGQAHACYLRGSGFLGYRASYFSGSRSGIRVYDRGFGGFPHRNFGGGRASGSSEPQYYIGL
jgi:hypothetical protein